MIVKGTANSRESKKRNKNRWNNKLPYKKNSCKKLLESNILYYILSQEKCISLKNTKLTLQIFFMPLPTKEAPTYPSPFEIMNPSNFNLLLIFRIAEMFQVAKAGDPPHTISCVKSVARCFLGSRETGKKFFLQFYI